MSKLLLIDDEEGIRKVLSISLRSDGYQVFTAASGEEALKIFEQEMPPIVLTDIKMPGMDGIEVLKRIKEVNPETEVIIITGHGEIDLAVEALQLEASDFVSKPIKDSALSIALKRANDKLLMKKQLKEYTEDLENMVAIATEEVRRRAELQNKLIASSNDGIVATDEKGMIIIVNPAAEEIFGYSRVEIIRKQSIKDLYPPSIASEFFQGLGKNKPTELSNWRESSIVRRDKESIPIKFSGSILHEREEVIGSVGFFQDLREMKRLEQELIKSERLAATGQTVAGLAHYIKNILFGLRGARYVLNVGFDENDTKRLRSGWDMMERNVNRISNLVMDLLNYSKEHEPGHENCLPNEITREVCDLMEPKMREERIEIARNFDQSIGEAYMDPEAIHRILMNLVSNAIDACLFDSDIEKKWRVEVRTTLINDHMLMLEVSDNGCGMGDEVKSQIFSSFFSTKGGKGTGLGLLITEKLVKENGGTIEVESEEGKGSTFTVRLPYKMKSKDARKRPSRR